VGELLVMIGAIHVGFWVALLSGMAMILGAVYMLVMYRRVMFEGMGGVVALLRDLSPREVAVLAPLAAVTLWMGIYPSSFTRIFDPTVTALTATPAAAAPVALGDGPQHLLHAAGAQNG
jgi:NADH-quinone oxidoreductase subunit M